VFQNLLKPQFYLYYLDAPSGKSILLEYETQNNSAINNINYYKKVGRLIYNPGVISNTINIPIINNSLYTGNKKFNIVFTKIENVTLDNNIIEVTIEDDEELPEVTYITSNSLSEASGTKEIGFYIDRPSVDDITINYAVIPGSADATDYSMPTTGLITIPAGSTKASLAISIANDAIDESNETFTIEYVSIENATFEGAGTPSTSVTIIDDDFAPNLTIAKTSSVSEGQSVQIPVTLNAPSSQEIVVNYEIRDGPNNSAVFNEDYQLPTSGTITFAAGETSKSIRISTLDDVFDEFDETLQIVLIDPVNAEIQNSVSILSIVDDDNEPSITIDDLIIREADVAGVVTLRLSAPSQKTIGLTYVTKAGTASSSDFYQANLAFEILPGQTSGFIDFSVVPNDGIYEQDETFSIVLADAINASIADDTSTITIINSDPLPSWEINVLEEIYVNEGDKVFTYNVDLDYGSVSENPLDIDYLIMPRSATPGADYNLASSGTITIPSLGTSATLSIPLIDDNVIEENEYFAVSLGYVGADAETYSTGFR